jgi:4-hydroxythreonine-4-phosphate dehydrogenase
MPTRPRLVVTVGDPAGVGPMVTVGGISSLPGVTSSHEVLVVGSRASLRQAADRLCHEWNDDAVPAPPWAADALPVVAPGRVGVIEPEGVDLAPPRPGEPTPEGGRLQLASIELAVGLVASGLARAMVTGPVSKIAITNAGVHFTGHTEHLARAAGLTPDQVTMMFVGHRLRVALVTTHLPIAEVPAALTTERIAGTLARVVTALRSWWGFRRPRVVVLGLNPHAGEEGLLGREEVEVIAPAIEAASSIAACDGALIEGPLPSEVGLRRAAAGLYDCAVAHYHDQATIPCKLLEQGQTVNVTLGLPYLRTSVDHGVGYDAAASGEVGWGSMTDALRLAADLTIRKS